MKQIVRFGSSLLLAVAALLMERGPLAQSGSGPHLYIADGGWDSAACRLIRMDDLTGTVWTAFGTKGTTGDTQFRDVSDIAVFADNCMLRSLSDPSINLPI